MTSARPNSLRAGIGLRLPHLAEVVADRPAIAWFEIHPENFLANPHAAELLEEVARNYPLSVHTVGISVGSASGFDRAHLKRLRGLIERIDPFLVSGHLAWSTHEGLYLNDLLPLPYTEETLELVAAHVNNVQDQLGRRFIIENPSSYVGFTQSTMNEVAFLRRLVEGTDCGLLCDVSNIHVSAHNLGFDAETYLAAFPSDAVAELHLGGFTVETDEPAPGAVLIDTHDTAIAEPSWALYAHAVRKFGAIPTLIERDSELPSLSVLIAEAEYADRIAAAHVHADSCHAVVA